MGTEQKIDNEKSQLIFLVSFVTDKSSGDYEISLIKKDIRIFVHISIL